LDAAGIRKRAATKGDAIVEVKPGEAVTSVIVAWTVERFVTLLPKGKTVKEEKTSSSKGKEGKKEAQPAKKATAKKASKPKSVAKKKKK
jgi:hypothetical protein